MSVGLILGLLLAMSIPAMGTEGYGSPNKVWICHFEDHTAPAPWSGGGTTLDGDYVLAYGNTSDSVFPGQNNIDYCESRGGQLLLVSVNSLGTEDDVRGHAPQLLDRVAGYPDGYKG